MKPKKANLKVKLMGGGYARLATGTQESMLEATKFIHSIEKRHGLNVACLEKISNGNSISIKKN